MPLDKDTARNTRSTNVARIYFQRQNQTAAWQNQTFSKNSFVTMWLSGPVGMADLIKLTNHVGHLVQKRRLVVVLSSPLVLLLHVSFSEIHHIESRTPQEEKHTPPPSGKLFAQVRFRSSSFPSRRKTSATRPAGKGIAKALFRFCSLTRAPAVPADIVKPAISRVRRRS